MIKLMYSTTFQILKARLLVSVLLFHIKDLITFKKLESIIDPEIFSIGKGVYFIKLLVVLIILILFGF